MNKTRNLPLFLLRVIVGWHFLYEGLVKLFTPGWSSQSYLQGSYGFLSDLFHAIAVNPSVVKMIDILNIWGLIFIGAGLFLGILIRLASVSGIALLMLYYFAYPPFGTIAQSVSQEGHYWIVNRNLIECIVLAVVYFYPAKDYSLLNILKTYRERSSDQAPEEVKGRREVIKGLVTLPFLGGIFYSAAKSASLNTDVKTGATLLIKTYDLKDLKGVMPKGKIGETTFSRMIMGCNLIGGWAHARDLIYSSSLFKHYNTEQKIFETWHISEQAGIDTTNLTIEMYPFFNKYKKLYGSNMKSIAQLHVVPEGKTAAERLINFKKCVDQGGTSMYIQGNTGDKLVQDQRLDLIQEAVEYTRSQGLVAGIGGHDILTCETCYNAGIKPDYFFKTMHHDRYWSASPAEYRKNFGVIGPQNTMDHNAIHDNMWDLFPDKTIEFFSKCDVPFVGFKVMAAGAIRPKDAFRYAFENGADFICVGMFDFQVIEDVNIANEILSSELKRSRPWYS